MKKVLIINGNPNKDSLNAAMAYQYLEGANQSTEQAELIHLCDLNFDPILHKGYHEKPEMEKDLLMMQEKIKSADHLVWAFPNWWGSVPALLKGFIDRTFMPGFAFRYVENSPFPQKLLQGKTAHLLITMDTPPFFFRYIYSAPLYNMMKKRVLKFVGFNKVKITAFGPVRNSNDTKRNKWLNKVNNLGVKLT